MKSRPLIAGMLGAGLVAGLSLSLIATEVTAADHAEAPETMMKHAADITDFYAWHKDDGKIVAIITYASFIEAGGPPEYDSGLVYGVHIDNDGDNEPDHDIWIRFGQNTAEAWGVQVTGLPGVADPVVGPVATPIAAGPGSEMVWVGLADDPFFFDLTGFTATLTTGTLSLDGSNDDFAGYNVMGIVVEISTDGAAGGSDVVKMWASTRG
ncbi:MAG: DUF4331 family protein [Nannocystaceae bacterium]